ncbi:twin transmembrane helix small protein [Zavarzinia sp.]|jgi:hypothetical protein|uniref:twin transmembrane helix small protein n=1 Tax=Zavarzinia sp. TaxID=2027920 RepID=UPI003562116E
MSGLLSFVIPVVMVALLVVLGMGIVVLVKGGPDRRFSNKLMQMRVLVQAVALALLMLALYLSGR